MPQTSTDPLALAVSGPSARAEVMGPRRIRLARLAVAVVFFTNGAGAGSWVSRIPTVQAALQAQPAELGVALFGLPFGLMPGVFFGGRLVARFGSRRTVLISAAAFCTALPLIALARNLWMLFLLLSLFGMAAAVLDVSMNTQASLVELMHGKPIMSGLHGAYSLGGLAGAALGGAAAAAGLGGFTHLLIAAAVVGLASAAASRCLLRQDMPADHTGPIISLSGRTLLLLGAVGFCGLMVEGAVADWSGVYLRDFRDAGPGLTPAGFAAFSIAMAAGRLAGDRVNARVGASALLRANGVLGAAGMLLALLSGSLLLSAIGFALVGLAMSTVFPLALSAAARTRGVRPGSAIAAVTGLGYFGLLAGPPLIGLVAQATRLPLALSILVLLSASIFLLAPATEPAE